MSKNNLITDLITKKYLKTPAIIKAFIEIKRVDFLLRWDEEMAETDLPLSIGYNQTISQPAVVAFMLEKLQPKAGHKVLDIGSGSGWTTALLSYLVREKGKVFAIEIIPELVKFGENNVAKYNFIEKNIAQFICGSGTYGYSQQAPYDRILISASAPKIFLAWKEQLNIGGIIVAVVEKSVWKIVKKSESEFEETEYPGFIFVPLI